MSQIRVWLHDRGNTTFGSGSMMFLGLTGPGTTDRKPDIGGSTTLNQALLVYQTDITTTQANTSQTELHGVLVDANSKSFGSPFAVGSGSSLLYDRENAAVTQVSDQPSVDWIVVWQESALFALTGIVAQRISASASSLPPPSQTGSSSFAATALCSA